MLITKHDIAKLVKFSVNIADADINPFILKAERTLPTLSDGVSYDTFAKLAPIEYELFNLAAETPAGAYREFNGMIWRAELATATLPAEDNLAWTALPEYAVYHLAIKRYLVFRAYDYFLVLHGLDVSQAGLTQQTGDRFAPISDSRRREIIASNRTDLINAENELNRYLKLYNYLPAPTECRPATSGRGRFGFGVAKNRYRD